ncbi:MAG TPA: hypothetical protein VMT29_12970 [Steroidobacteraceae bacterium]|nr:hypothetical protein [Steroidobacteraceae bacterium]
MRFPQALNPDLVYRLWVVTASGEWSQPILLNDPRPLWISPGYIFSTRDPSGLHRRLRVVGRNLASHTGISLIHLQGPADYLLTVQRDAADPGLDAYVAEAALPDSMKPGLYTVGVGCNGCTWTTVAQQRFEVRPDPPEPVELNVSETRFGSCRSDGVVDDCLERALAAARQSGSAVIVFPAGKWRVSHASGQPAGTGGFILPPGVGLRGAGSGATTLLWLSRQEGKANTALLILTGHNSISDMTFADTERFASPAESRPVIQLGAGTTGPRGTATPHVRTAGEDVGGGGHDTVGTIDDIRITDNRFIPVGGAIVDSGRPLAHLLILRNEFGAYDNALYLAHVPRLSDSVIRRNRFLPGSYLDVSAHQGSIASQIGSSLRVDFSSNEADGASSAALQSPEDPHGFRAAFFWNMEGNHEFALVADNHIQCSGDKAGDGEALAFDGNGNTSGFERAEPISGAGADWITVHATLNPGQHGHPVASDYYTGHWLFLVSGRGAGQSRRIAGYAADGDAGTASAPVGASTSLKIRVSPAWDVVPAAGARIIVERQYWQLYVVANRIAHGSPPCGKTNLNSPKGGEIVIWAPSADSVIAGNRQKDGDGIGFLQSYSARAASCAGCDSSASIQSALEIRENRIEGEYDWSSDCSRSGISGEFSASPTPDSPPPVLSYGVTIDHNQITRADGIRGGAIGFALTWHPGPPPGDWPLVVSPLISHNRLRDLDGEAPRPTCHFGQKTRTGIRIEGQSNVRGAVLYANECTRVAQGLDESGQGTVHLCERSSGSSCECQAGTALHASDPPRGSATAQGSR